MSPGSRRAQACRRCQQSKLVHVTKGNVFSTLWKPCACRISTILGAICLHWRLVTVRFETKLSHRADCLWGDECQLSLSHCIVTPTREFIQLNGSEVQQVQHHHHCLRRFIMQVLTKRQLRIHAEDLRVEDRKWSWQSWSQKRRFYILARLNSKVVTMSNSTRARVPANNTDRPIVVISDSTPSVNASRNSGLWAAPRAMTEYTKWSAKWTDGGFCGAKRGKLTLGKIQARHVAWRLAQKKSRCAHSSASHRA